MRLAGKWRPFARFRDLRRSGVLGINRRNLDVLVRLNPKCLYALVDDKLATKLICRRLGISVPETYAVLELYRPHQSIAVKVEKGVGDTPNRVIVNILSKDATPSANRTDPTLAAEAKEYQIDGQPIMIGDKETLVRTFRARKADAKSLKFKEEDFSVEIRGDKDVNYMYVAPILRAAAEADIAKMNITALQGAGGA